ncbi:hypothetical protein QL285_043697 [Trifolium repens]|nr:hypothetical protein QL285_043697 [Trifolium repens]
MNSGRIFEVKCLTQEFQKNRVWTGLQSIGDFSFSVALILIPLVGFCRICIWIGMYIIGFIIFGQEMRAVAISKVGHKMQNFAEGESLTRQGECYRSVGRKARCSELDLAVACVPGTELT